MRTCPAPCLAHSSTLSSSTFPVAHAAQLSPEPHFSSPLASRVTSLAHACLLSRSCLVPPTSLLFVFKTTLLLTRLGPAASYTDEFSGIEKEDSLSFPKTPITQSSRNRARVVGRAARLLPALETGSPAERAGALEPLGGTFAQERTGDFADHRRGVSRQSLTPGAM